jgi:hypothetical protein
MNIDDGDEIFQESPTKKAAWLEEVQRRFPVGTRVKIKGSDLPEYIGRTGTVVDYDLGNDGDWPLAGVKFDGEHTPPRDGFYDDELEAEAS